MQASSFSKDGVTKENGMLLYHVATKIKPQISAQIPLLARYIVEKKIDSELRLNGNQPDDDYGLPLHENLLSSSFCSCYGVSHV